MALVIDWLIDIVFINIYIVNSFAFKLIGVLQLSVRIPINQSDKSGIAIVSLRMSIVESFIQYMIYKSQN